MKGYKTILAAIAVIVMGALEQFDVTSIIPDQYDGLALAVVGLVMAGLRLITSTPVGNKE